MLLVRRRVHESRHQIGERARRIDALDGRQQFVGRLRQELDRLDRLAFEMDETGLDLVRLRSGLRNLFRPGDEEWPAGQIVEDPEPLLALADEMVGPVRRGDVANDIGDRSHPMQVDRKGIGDIGVALHDNADRSLFPYRSLRRQHRRGRPRVIGNTVPGNSTMPRTGTMISASGGNGSVEAPAIRFFFFSPRFVRFRIAAGGEQPRDDEHGGGRADVAEQIVMGPSDVGAQLAIDDVHAALHNRFAWAAGSGQCAEPDGERGDGLAVGVGEFLAVRSEGAGASGRDVPLAGPDHPAVADDGLVRTGRRIALHRVGRSAGVNGVSMHGVAWFGQPGVARARRHGHRQTVTHRPFRSREISPSPGGRLTRRPAGPPAAPPARTRRPARRPAPDPAAATSSGSG